MSLRVTYFLQTKQSYNKVDKPLTQELLLERLALQANYLR